MKRGFILSIALLATIFAATTFAHDEVLPDRIVMHNGEFLPRFLDLPGSFVVVQGAVAVLNAGTYGTIEVRGTLTIPAVEVKVTHLIVLPGGVLTVECGARIIGRDVPLDTARDPFQWGNGLVNFGTLVAPCPDEDTVCPHCRSGAGRDDVDHAHPAGGLGRGRCGDAAGHAPDERPQRRIRSDHGANRTRRSRHSQALL